MAAAACSTEGSSRGRFSVVGSICTLLTKSDSEMTGASFWTGTSAIAGWREALGVAKGCYLVVRAIVGARQRQLGACVLP
mmetsp:Transcript_15812/g.44979  ORF Transcript_15812/g.44979 Transcript_15812/m.44979 type:complete len:80 (-) Transcript_15812:15-254(-)